MATGKPFFIVIKCPRTGKGYVHQNIGHPQAWIVGPNQTCHWYKLKRDAVTRAAELNKGYQAQAGENVRTFAANLAHAIRKNENVAIGGGIFSPAELRDVLDKLERG